MIIDCILNDGGADGGGPMNPLSMRPSKSLEMSPLKTQAAESYVVSRPLNPM